MEVRCQPQQLKSDQLLNPAYAADSPDWEDWFVFEHEEQRRRGVRTMRAGTPSRLVVRNKDQEADAAYQEEERHKEEEAYQARMTEAMAVSAAGDCIVPPLAPPSPAKAEPGPIALKIERYTWDESGGPYRELPLGRRDSKIAYMKLANKNLPPPNATLHRLVKFFGRQRLDKTDLVALSGSHTIGMARCVSFKQRLYNQHRDNKPDMTLEKRFYHKLASVCPCTGGDNNITPLDFASPPKFDNNYYKLIVVGRGLLNSDQVGGGGRLRGSGAGRRRWEATLGPTVDELVASVGGMARWGSGDCCPLSYAHLEEGDGGERRSWATQVVPAAGATADRPSPGSGRARGGGALEVEIGPGGSNQQPDDVIETYRGVSC
ncbi:Peroxidase 9 [Hordeum vulgare]|nr:Peroxidase 9 [Hordeum vulgare]